MAITYDSFPVGRRRPVRAMPPVPAKKPRNYFSRREQRKLLALVMGIGLVILVFSEARQLEKWSWLWQEDDGTASQERDYTHFDTRYQPQPSGDEEDLETVRILPHDPTLVERQRYFPGVDPQLLREVDDYAPFQSVDGKPWYHLLGILQQADSAELRRASGGEVSFLQLYEQPEAYRGELVTLHGTVKRATRESARRNSQGIEGYYQLVVQPHDGPLRPIAVKVLELPDKFPVEDKIREEVVLTGFFFKNLAYLAEDGNDYIMPVVLAKDIAWQPAPSVERWVPSTLLVWSTISGMAVVAVMLSLLVYFQSNTIRLPGNADHRQPAPDNFESLQNAPVRTVAEQLDALADRN